MGAASERGSRPPEASGRDRTGRARAAAGRAGRAWGRGRAGTLGRRAADVEHWRGGAGDPGSGHRAAPPPPARPPAAPRGRPLPAGEGRLRHQCMAAALAPAERESFPESRGAGPPPRACGPARPCARPGCSRRLDLRRRLATGAPPPLLAARARRAPPAHGGGGGGGGAASPGRAASPTRVAGLLGWARRSLAAAGAPLGRAPGPLTTTARMRTEPGREAGRLPALPL